MEKLFKESLCLFCQTANQCLLIPCSHSICKNCYTDFYRPRLLALYNLICENVDNFNGKSTCLGCPYNCESSKLTVDSFLLRKLFSERNDQQSVNIIHILKLFLTGIPTYFLNCANCQLLHAELNPVNMCPEINKRLVPELNKRTAELIEEYKNPIREFDFADLASDSYVKTEPENDFLILLDDLKQPKYAAQNTRIFKLSKSNAANSKYFALASIEFTNSTEFFVFLKTGTKPLIKVIYTISNTWNANNSGQNIVQNLLTTNNLRISYEFVRDISQRLSNDQIVNQQGTNYLLLIRENKDVYFEKVDNLIKVYKFNNKFLSVNILFTVCKAIVVKEDDDSIYIEQFDMLSFSRVYKVTRI